MLNLNLTGLCSEKLLWEKIEVPSKKFALGPEFLWEALAITEYFTRYSI
jgi:hypothetical protein